MRMYSDHTFWRTDQLLPLKPPLRAKAQTQNTASRQLNQVQKLLHNVETITYFAPAMRRSEQCDKTNRMEAHHISELRT